MNTPNHHYLLNPKLCNRIVFSVHQILGIEMKKKKNNKLEFDKMKKMGNLSGVSIFLIDAIKLNIKRVGSSKSSCAYPKCTIKTGLKRLSIQQRYNIATQSKKNFPRFSVVCSTHLNIDLWKNVNVLIKEGGNKFTKEQLEEWIMLLSDSSLALQDNLPSRMNIISVLFSSISQKYL